jgi:hypothetical protein
LASAPRQQDRTVTVGRIPTTLDWATTPRYRFSHLVSGDMADVDFGDMLTISQAI